jgi:predicted Fe-Mo cluster-binding NifX family protein
MKLTFALALNNEGVFENKHFGESDKFALYVESENEIRLEEEVANDFKTLDQQAHGSKTKGNAIISFLKDKKVDVLVSKQFGKNINLVNQHFIPVIIHEQNSEHVLKILEKHKNWLKDELGNRESDFMLFQIKNGILKSKIKAV